MQRRTQLVDQDGRVVRQVRRRAWSPAQLVAVAAGILLIAWGALGLARAGTNFSHLTVAHAQVAGLGISPLSALADLVVGVLLLAGGAFAASSKVASALFGVLVLAFGLVVALNPKPFRAAWDYHKENGIVFVIIGAVLLVTAAVSPILSSRSEARVPRRRMSRQPVSSRVRADEVAAREQSADPLHTV